MLLVKRDLIRSQAVTRRVYSRREKVANWAVIARKIFDHYEDESSV